MVFAMGATVAVAAAALWLTIDASRHKVEQ
jgi:hypothetical protein